MDLKNYPITTHYGEIDSFHSTPHSGIDIACKTGTKIIAQDDGIVTLTTDKWLGNTIRLKIKNGDIIIYGHLSEYKVYNNQTIQAGDLLGLTGGAVGSKNSGRTTGEHVHVSVYSGGKLIDPTPYLFNQQQNSTYSLAFPIILVLMLIITWKLRKIFFYSLMVFTLLLVIFISS